MTRLSVGVQVKFVLGDNNYVDKVTSQSQSFLDEDLKLMNRDHSVAESEQ